MGPGTVGFHDKRGVRQAERRIMAIERQGRRLEEMVPRN